VPRSAAARGWESWWPSSASRFRFRFSTPVNRIVWSKRDVTVETRSGRIAARAAIITVSSNILATGNIKFDPELPRRHLDAAGKLTLGSYDRIALQMSGNPLGLARDDILVEQSNSTRTALLSANIGGSTLCSIDIAGAFGRDLSAQGEQAMVAFAKEWLTKLFGSEAAAAVKKSSATNWNSAPYVLGAMSAAAPGSQPSRKILTEPIGCVFLAGEATHETQWARSTAPGTAASAPLRRRCARSVRSRMPNRRRHLRGRPSRVAAGRGPIDGPELKDPMPYLRL